MSTRQSNENIGLKKENIPKEPETAEEYLQYAQELMGNGSNQPAPTTPRSSTPSESGELSYTEQVNKLIKEVTVNEEGKFVYPDGTPEHLKYAVATEKKYRDTQSGFTKARQSLKESDTENEALRNQLTSSTISELKLSIDDQDRLDDLMNTDPNAWRREMNELETAHTTNERKKLEDTMGTVRQEAGHKFELDRRVESLKQFNEGRSKQLDNDGKPLAPLTATIFDNDIPPRIGKKLTDGLITFEGYLAECSDYLAKGRVVSNQEADNGTKLTSGAGSHNPPKESTNLENGALDYSNLVL